MYSSDKYDNGKGSNRIWSHTVCHENKHKLDEQVIDYDRKPKSYFWELGTFR